MNYRRVFIPGASYFFTLTLQAKGERGIWQRRFWEHLIRNDQDYEKHLDYIHYNPVKHGYVNSPAQWPYSSIHRYINLGILPLNWASDDAVEKGCNLQFGE